MSEETEVGSIVGRLRIDSSAWNAALDAAEAKARELESVDPKVKIETTGAADASAKLDAVAAAEHRLDVASRQAANAASTAYVASERLKVMRERGSATTLQLTAAEEALARADRNAEGAELRHLAATEALNKAKETAVARTVEDAAATETDTAAKKNNTQATQNNAGAMGLLWSALAMIAPAAVPIAAAATAGGVALAGMGAAGILAIKGIHDEMAAGTYQGNQYAAGLSVLKDDLDGLSRTGASAFLNTFQGGVATLNGVMPQLTSDVSVFGAEMGNTVTHGLGFALGAMQALQPAAVIFGAWLTNVTAKLDAFGHSQGMKDFAEYAMQAIPPVTATIESLVTAAFHLLQGLAPIGNVALTSLKVLADAINALPVEAITVLAPAVSGAVGAFMLFKNVIPVLEAFGIAENIALGPVGLIVAGVGLLAGALVGMSAATQTNTGDVTSWTTALEQSNGAIDANIQKMAAKKAEDGGLLDAANQLGISLPQVTDAILGQGDSLDQVKAKAEQAIDAYDNSAVSVDNMGRATHLVTQQQQDQYDAATKLLSGISSLNGGLQQGEHNYKNYTSAITSSSTASTAQAWATQQAANAAHMSVDAYLAAGKAADAQAAQQQAAANAMYRENDAGGLLKVTLDALNGKTISAAQAQNTFDSAIANSDKHVDATGKTINRASTSLDGMSAAAVKNRGELINQVTDLNSVAEAMRNNGAKTDETRNKMIAMRNEIIDNAVAHGENRDSVIRYLDSLFKIPRSIPPTQLEVDNAQAVAAIAAVKAGLDNLHDKVIYTTIMESTMNSGNTGLTSGVGTHGGGTRFAQREGGLVPRHLASGGWADITGGGLLHGAGGPTQDLVPIMGSPDEFMTKASSVRSIGPDAFEYMNRTGQLLTQPVPVPSGPAPAPVVHVYIDGREMRSDMVNVAVQQIGNWVADQNRRRPGA
ncbi:hypothetical protein KIH31_08505 [Paenarthrobacter sp. DKR-5]|uniref:hypothetical protein n=1 Tax=Paenarthrobacter sp. DKR-5 TaxID=2835535 RepID=UPI001BDBF1CE|nr:hypothetical protein [Paenarthrobacter sp. DKR-5]MBT1002642.1 hypothetical protein [Paenarthrobacter sp. DKR-5]